MVVSVLALFGAIGTILSKNAIHSVMYLILTFFSLSAHYILLNAQFLAVVNIIVYAGAIMVLFLFVVMFLNIKEENNELTKNSTLIVATILGSSLGVIIVAVIRQSQSRPVQANYTPNTGMIETLGKALYTDFLLPFELISVLFLVAMVGAVMLGKREKGERNF
jgi:NADH-quinone oxidoreductase subunit J